MPPHDAADPETAFRDRFATLVRASSLSTREIAKRTGVGRSTVHGWQRGEALPQNPQDLLRVVTTLRAATTAAGIRDAWWP